MSNISEENSIYSKHHLSFFDKIVHKKRIEMINIINQTIQNQSLYDVLDVGTTIDKKNISSNSIIKNLNRFKIYKSISDQEINLKLFNKCLQKSITDDLTDDEIKNFSSDLVISNATIEHVGNEENQLKMIKNIISLSKKYFIIITPNRYHPIEFHTKIPFIHWLPKKIHRKTLSIIGLKFLSKEENLNLLSKNDLNLMMKKLNYENYYFKKINFLFLNSNLILLGKK